VGFLRLAIMEKRVFMKISGSYVYFGSASYHVDI
jgi:hypothetical protein